MDRYTRLFENTLARQDFDLEPAELYRPVSYILSLGGKRMRPALTLAACELAGGQAEDALMPALAIEVFHNFSLLHDDIMDKALLRRGQQTVHEKWDVNTAILSGDAMLVKSYQYLAEVDKAVLPAVLKVFSQTALEVCEGQQYDLNFENQEKVTEADYLEMIRLKTSVLVGCALKVGALTGGATSAGADRLYRFGENIGIAFQIQDDILDCFGSKEKVGKEPGGDILNHKKTLLMLHARSEGNPEQQQTLARTYSSNSEKIVAVKSLFEETGARTYATQKMEAYYHEALKNLDEVSGDAKIKLELANFAEWLIHREH